MFQWWGRCYRAACSSISLWRRTSFSLHSVWRRSKPSFRVQSVLPPCLSTLTCDDDVGDVSLPGEHLQPAHGLLVPHDLVQLQRPVLLHPGQLVGAPGAFGRGFPGFSVRLLSAFGRFSPTFSVRHLHVHDGCCLRHCRLSAREHKRNFSLPDNHATVNGRLIGRAFIGDGSDWLRAAHWNLAIFLYTRWLK